MFTITFKDSDLVRCRFVYSPLWETQQAVRVLRDPDRRPALAGWLRRVEGGLDQVDVASLGAVMPRGGYQPDFMTVPNASGIRPISDLLAQLRATDIAVVAEELSRCPMPAGSAGEVLESFLKDPAGARDVIADCFERVWNQLIEPDWPAIEAVLEADIAYRSAKLMAEGLAGVMEDLHPTINWDAPVLMVESTFHGHVRPAGQGLVFQSSVFTGPDRS